MKFEKIVSLENLKIKSIISLHDPKKRVLLKKFIAEGERICATLISFKFVPVCLYITEEILKKSPKFLQNQKVVVVSEQVMKKISQATTPSGILGVYKMPEKQQKLTSGIVLAQISDPGNMGTLIRTAAAMGIKSVVLVEGADPWSFKTVQATAGAIAKVNIFRWSWKQLMENKGDLKLLALVVKGGKSPQKINYFDESLLVIGSEAHGIPEKWLKDCYDFVTIEMPGGIESLNAAVAGAIAMYLLIKIK